MREALPAVGLSFLVRARVLGGRIRETRLCLGDDLRSVCVCVQGFWEDA